LNRCASPYLVVLTFFSTLFILIYRIDFPSRQVAKKVREATPEEKIAQLEEIRATYVTKQMGIQRKIDELERRKSGMTREESIQGRERKRNW